MNIEQHIHFVTVFLVKKLRKFYRIQSLTKFDREYAPEKLWKTLWIV